MMKAPTAIMATPYSACDAKSVVMRVASSQRQRIGILLFYLVKLYYLRADKDSKTYKKGYYDDCQNLGRAFERLRCGR